VEQVAVLPSQWPNLHLPCTIHCQQVLALEVKLPVSTLRKTAKCALAKKLRKDQSPVESIADNLVCVIDGMALVQRVKGNNLQ